MSMSNVTHVVVHYSASYADQDIGAAEIDRWHRDRRPPFRMIGYHDVIRRDGTHEKGRPYDQVGAHVGAQNTGKIGICWVGGINRETGPNVGVDNRTPEQTEALIRLIRDHLSRHPNAKVVGHRDLANTQCPGFDVPAWWAKVQKKKVLAPTAVRGDAPAITSDVVEAGTHIVEKGDTWWSVSREHGLSVDDLTAINGTDASAILKPGRVLWLRWVEESVPEPPVQPQAPDHFPSPPPPWRHHHPEYAVGSWGAITVIGATLAIIAVVAWWLLV